MDSPEIPFSVQSAEKKLLTHFPFFLKLLLETFLIVTASRDATSTEALAL